VSPLETILIVVVILAIAFAAWMFVQKQRTQKLRSQFGPEYDKAVGQHRDRSRAEAALEQRAKRVAQFHIRPLKNDERTRFAENWRKEQAMFVDDPRTAVAHADTLVQEVMKLRGYPVGDFEQNAADLSVDHPKVVTNYRAAHAIAVRDQAGEGSTEDLRQAMVSYRALFEELLDQHVMEHEEVRQ
jgi:ABC-type nickel/cobalt efflux system permease component RcnA